MHNAHSTWLHHTSHFIHCSQLGAVAMHNILQNAHFTAHRVTSAQCTAHTLLSDGSSGPQWVPRLDLEAAAIRCERGVTKSRRQHWHNVETQATPDIMNLRQFRGSLLLDLQFIRATRWKSWPNQEITVVIKLCGRKFESSWLLLIVYFEKILCEYSNSRHSLNPDPPPNSLFLNFSSPLLIHLGLNCLVDRGQFKWVFHIIREKSIFSFFMLAWNVLSFTFGWGNIYIPSMKIHIPHYHRE